MFTPYATFICNDFLSGNLQKLIFVFRSFALKAVITKMALVLSFCFVVAGGSNSSAEPLFPNSVVSNDIDFILTDDPTVAYKVVDQGRSRQEMPASLTVESLWQDQAYVLQINYEDGATVAIWADEKFEKVEDVVGYAEKIANALGKLPKPLRSKLKRVVLHKGDRVASSEHKGHFFMMYAENIDKRISTHDLEETIFHETIHATLEYGHALSEKWLAAQKADGDFCTTYAADNPKQEDLSESALFAYTLIRHPGRMPDVIEAKVKQIMPNRIEYLRALFADLESAVNQQP